MGSGIDLSLPEKFVKDNTRARFSNSTPGICSFFIIDWWSIFCLFGSPQNNLSKTLDRGGDRTYRGTEITVELGDAGGLLMGVQQVKTPVAIIQWNYLNFAPNDEVS